MALDGVNTDYTDAAITDSQSGSKNFLNTLKFAFAFNHAVGAQFYWTVDSTKYKGYDTTNPASFLDSTKKGTSNTYTSTDTHAEGQEKTTDYDVLKNYDRTNTFGFDFNGISTPKLGPVQFYAALNEVEVAWARRYAEAEYDTRTTQNGATTERTDYSGTYKFATVTPALEGEVGITLPKLFDLITPSIVLVERYQVDIPVRDSSFSSTKWERKSATQTTTTTTDGDVDFGDYINWKNTLTPKFNFAFDLGERFTLKTRVAVPVAFGHYYNEASRYSKTETESTYNEATGLTTVTKTVTRGWNSSLDSSSTSYGYDEDVFTTTVDPAFMLGMVYQVVPGRFNVNFGTKVKSGLMTWKTTEKTLGDADYSKTVYQTTDGGATYTKSYEYTANGGDTASASDSSNAEETKESTFSVDAPSAELYLGGTWFLTDRVQMDVYACTGTITGGKETFDCNLNVQFGFRF